MVAIPNAFLESLGLVANAKVVLSIDGRRLIIEPQPSRRCSLAELLEQCDLSVPPPEEDMQWDSAQPVGRELF